MNLRTIAAALCCLGLSACGGARENQEALPKAGEMKLISLTEAAAPEHASLLHNGDFDDWYAGSAGPEGVQLPDSKFSKLVRWEQLGVGVKSRYQANQIWTQEDAGLSPDKLFGIFGDGLQPDTTYTLRAVATSKKEEGTNAHLSVYEVHDDQHELIAKDIITTTFERSRTYTAKFKTKKGGRILVVSTAATLPKDNDAKKWHRVTWHAISVTP